MKKIIFALIGESGCGKTTLLNELIKNCKEINGLKLKPIVRVTTRPIRDGEIEGKDYYFCNNDDFLKMTINNEFINAEVYNNWGYGLLRNTIQDNCINVGTFTPSEILTISENSEDVIICIFRIKVSGKTRIIRNLLREENPDINEVFRRYNADLKDFAEIDETLKYYEYNNETNSPHNFIKWIKKQFTESQNKLNKNKEE